ncbi:hypothetical protein [Sphingobacterium hungaricum]|uniref:Uncharacterized protein n=1 Tax=Sphingobacterium hungaricum TaxID=2082723 RepID=A0A928UVZ3_9SPHI|nr:hypothetical protein [Sphingobacterium hungaricum]MBE8712310.1 hypothetical protein [Sphingobacterium hungaricum]
MQCTCEFLSYSIDNFGKTMLDVIKKQKNNQTYKDEWPNITLLEPVSEAFFMYVDEVENNKQRNSISNRNNERTKAENILRDNVKGVNKLAHGDEAILKGCGLPTTKVGAKAKVPLVPITEFEVGYTARMGVFKIKFKAQHSMNKASIYFTPINPAGQTNVNWSTSDHYKSKFLFESGLTSGTIFLKLVLFADNNDIVESTVYEFAISKIGM